MKQIIFKHPKLKNTGLLKLNNNVYRAGYYDGVNELGYGNLLRQALRYLNVPSRRHTIMLGYIESLKDYVENNKEVTQFELGTFAGMTECHYSMPIYFGSIEGIPAVILLYQDGTPNIHISENSLINPILSDTIGFKEAKKLQKI